MQKIIIDTNVLVSALIQKSYPYFILEDILIGNKFEVFLSEILFEEYFEVLSRPKFAKFPDFHAKVKSVLADVYNLATIYNPEIKIEKIKDDADNRLLELATESGADYIITGNIKDFTFSEFNSTKIVSPKEFCDSYIL